MQSGPGLDIEGLEEVPAAILPVPFLRLIQPVSKGIQKADGSDATMGNFLYNDTKEEITEIRFVLLKAKVTSQLYEGNTEPTAKLNVLGYDLNREKVFILQLSVMSFSQFGGLVTQMKEQKLTKSYQNIVLAKAEKMENQKGKFYVVNFQLQEKVPNETLDLMADQARIYGVALSKDLSDTTEPVEIEVEPAPIPEENQEQVNTDDLPF